MARRLRTNEIDYSQCRCYHVVTRCARSLRLLGTDDEARKNLILECLGLLTDATCIEVLGFALMDNHLHLLLRVDPAQAKRSSPLQVARRWALLHPPRNSYFRPIEATDDYLETQADDAEGVDATRLKLASISQYMKELKQRIAQLANRADGMTGAFWEGRFKIKAVQTEVQLLATMAYIDLNPFAANLCRKPEEGKYTSLEVRLSRTRANTHRSSTRRATTQTTPRNRSTRRSAVSRANHWLVPLEASRRGRGRPLLPGLSLRRYLLLIDHTSRLLRRGKRTLRRDTQPILNRLAVTTAGLRDQIATIQEHWRRFLPEPKVTHPSAR